MANKKNKTHLDAVVCSVEWGMAREAAFVMAARLQSEVDDLTSSEIKNAYSPMAWISI